MSVALAANPQQISTPVDTVGILHSIEDVYGLPYLVVRQIHPTAIRRSPRCGIGGAYHHDNDGGAHHHNDGGVHHHNDSRVHHHNDGVHHHNDGVTTTTTAAPTTTTTAASTATTLGVGDTSGGGSGGSSVVSASSSALAFTGLGSGVGRLVLLGSGLVLLGLALFAAVGAPRRFLGQLALCDSTGGPNSERERASERAGHGKATSGWSRRPE